MSSAQTVEQAALWCQEARRILNRKWVGTSEKSRMGDYTNKLKTLLTEMKTISDLSSQFRTMATEFKRLATLAHQIETSGDSKSKKQEKITSVSEELGVLTTQVEKCLQDYKTYSSGLEDAEQKQRELLTLNRDTYVYDTPVTTAITDAKQLAGQGKHSEAAGKFSSVANDYKTQKQKAATDRSNDLDDIRRKPVYDDKVRRIKEAIDQLEKLAGTGEHRKQLQKLIDDSASLAKSGKYQDAYKKLKGLSGTLDAGLKAAGKFETEAGDSTFQGLRTAMARNLSRYEEIAGLADADFIKDAHKSDHEILCTLETTPPATLDTAVKEKAIKDIRELDAEIQGKISDVNRVKSLCDPLLEEVDDNVSVLLRKSAPTNVYEPFLASYRAANSLYGIQDYAGALVMLNQLKSDSATSVNTYKPPYDQWADLSKTVDDVHLSVLKDVQEIDPKGNDWRKHAGLLLVEYSSIKEMVVNTHDYKSAVIIANKVINDVPSQIKPKADQYKELATKREEGWKKFELEEQNVLKKIEELKGKGGDVTPFVSRLDVVRNAWRDLCSQVSTENQLNSAISDMPTKAGEIVSDIQDILDDTTKDGKLEKSVEAAEDVKTQKSYAQVTSELQRVIDYFEKEYPGGATTYKNDLDRITGAVTTQQAGKANKTNVEVLTQKLGELKQEITTKQEEIDRLAVAGQEKVKAALERVKKLKKKHGKFEKFFAELSADIQDCVEMTKSSVKAVVELSVNRLSTGGDLDSKLADLETTADFANVESALTTLKNDIDKDSNLKQCKPTLQKTLQLKLKETFTPDCYKTSPDKALEVLDPLKREVAQAKLDAQAAADARARIKQLEKDAKTALNSLSKSDVPELYASFEGRIKAAASPGQGAEYDSESKLKALIKIIERVASPEHLDQRTAMEKQAVQNKYDGEKAKLEYEAKLDLFHKNEKRAAKSAHDETPNKDRDDAFYQRMLDAEKEAKKLAGKNAFAQALDKIDLAIQIARDFAVAPYNSRTSARKALKKLPAKWKKAVGEFVAEVNQLSMAIETEVKQNGGQPDASAALNRIGRLKSMFDPAKFDKVVEHMTAEDTNFTDLRFSKEKGLRFVQMYRMTLGKDPMLALLDGPNPFHSMALKMLRNGLADLELNLKRA